MLKWIGLQVCPQKLLGLANIGFLSKFGRKICFTNFYTPRYRGYRNNCFEEVLSQFPRGKGDVDNSLFRRRKT
jgi:hypothetical protein